MYDSTLVLHNGLRWAVIAVGLYAIARALAGWAGANGWSKADDSAGKWFTILLDTQLLIGLALYALLSPITRAAFSDFGGAMGDRDVRFWAVEHTFGMLLALIAVHVARAKTRRAPDAARKHRIAAIGFGIGLLLILLSIPWPFLSYGRPLFRLP